MRENNLYLPWPGADDRIVVEEMLRDPNSGQWYECREFVKKRVQIQAKNIPKDQRDDLVNDALLRIAKSLPTFQYDCLLKTWFFVIIRNSIIDAHRKLKHDVHVIVPLGDPHADSMNESDAFTTNTLGTVEDECIIRDELKKAVVALQEYVATHANPLRNGRIVDMVIFEGHSLEEAAKVVGCSAAVAGYVVRSAQRYAREKSKE